MYEADILARCACHSAPTRFATGTFVLDSPKLHSIAITVVLLHVLCARLNVFVSAIRTCQLFRGDLCRCRSPKTSNTPADGLVACEHLSGAGCVNDVFCLFLSILRDGGKLHVIERRGVRALSLVEKPEAFQIYSLSNYHTNDISSTPLPLTTNIMTDHTPAGAFCSEQVQRLR